MKLCDAIEILWERPTNKVWHHIPTLRYWYVFRKSRYKDIDRLLSASNWEHRFQLLQTSYLVEWLKEIHLTTNDQLTKKLISNLLEKQELNKLIHARSLFPNASD